MRGNERENLNMVEGKEVDKNKNGVFEMRSFKITNVLEN